MRRGLGGGKLLALPEKMVDNGANVKENEEEDGGYMRSLETSVHATFFFFFFSEGIFTHLTLINQGKKSAVPLLKHRFLHPRYKVFDPKILSSSATYMHDNCMRFCLLSWLEKLSIYGR